MSRQHIKARAQALKAKAAKRTEKALELLESGKGVVAVAKQLGIHRKTLYRNLKKLNQQQNAVNAESLDQMRARQHNELRTMMDFVLNSPEMTDAEVAANFRLYAADIAKLMGLNAPDRSIHANATVQLTPEYIEIARLMADVADEDRPRVVEFIRSLVKPLEITAEMMPPTLQLKDGQ